MQLRLIPSNIAFACERELQQGGGECALRRNCEQAGPPHYPGRARSGLQSCGVGTSVQPQSQSGRRPQRSGSGGRAQVRLAASTARPGCTFAPRWGSPARVTGLTMAGGKPVRHDLDASVIGDRDDVHVGEANIAGDPRAAHPRNGPLEGQSSRCQHARSSTCGPVVPERVEAATAGACRCL